VTATVDSPDDRDYRLTDYRLTDDRDHRPT